MVCPCHEEPVHSPCQLFPCQLLPSQSVPYHVVAYQRRIAHDDAGHVSASQSPVRNPIGSPRRSWALSWPVTTVRSGSLVWTRTRPRLASSDPRPLECGGGPASAPP